MTASRHYSVFDQLCLAADGLLRAAFVEQGSGRPRPDAGLAEAPLDDGERRHAAGLMRVNHVGEVCAQALYLGQALTAREPALRQHLLQSAREEADHLHWCRDRVAELGERTSLLNPLWAAGSFGLGALAGLAGDGWNLGFVVETERQVEAHLDDHLQSLPTGDARSRAIVAQMKTDEIAHADAAQARGARALPLPVRSAMRATAKLMTSTAYRF